MRWLKNNYKILIKIHDFQSNFVSNRFQFNQNSFQILLGNAERAGDWFFSHMDNNCHSRLVMFCAQTVQALWLGTANVHIDGFYVRMPSLLSPLHSWCLWASNFHQVSGSSQALRFEIIDDLRLSQDEFKK